MRKEKHASNEVNQVGLRGPLSGLGPVPGAKNSQQPVGTGQEGGNPRSITSETSPLKLPVLPPT